MLRVCVCVIQVIGSVQTVLKTQYGTTYTGANASKYVADIAFVGTVVGQLAFGFLADRWSRTNTLLISTSILIVFTALAAGSYFKGQAVGLFNILAAWRFFVGIGIGGAQCKIPHPLIRSLFPTFDDWTGIS